MLQKFRTGKITLFKTSAINKMLLRNPERDLRFTKNKNAFIEKLLQFQDLYQVSLLYN